ncbi:haloacid dehalogenase-like hydrolase (HAD) superfamily protein isoform X2 [Wolffia australiana]
MEATIAGVRVQSPSLTLLRRNLDGEGFKFASGAAAMRIKASPFGFPLRRNGLRANCSLAEPIRGESAQKKIGVLIEVEGVLVDVYRFGNRQAFNVAFQRLGLDCANWTEPIYLDLTRKAAGDEEMMLVLFFNRIGWPTSLATNEKNSFVKRIIQEKHNAVDSFLVSGNLPLRPGVENFIDDALNVDIPVIMLTAYSRSGDKLSRFLEEKLGLDRVSKIKILGKKAVGESLYGQLVLGKGATSSLDDQLLKEAQKAVSKEKQRVAEEVASALKLSIDIDTTPPESEPGSYM